MTLCSSTHRCALELPPAEQRGCHWLPACCRPSSRRLAGSSTSTLMVLFPEAPLSRALRGRNSHSTLTVSSLEALTKKAPLLAAATWLTARRCSAKCATCISCDQVSHAEVTAHSVGRPACRHAALIAAGMLHNRCVKFQPNGRLWAGYGSVPKGFCPPRKHSCFAPW